jgi:hypothetical protein
MAVRTLLTRVRSGTAHYSWWPGGTKRRKVYVKGGKAAPSRVGDVSELNELQAVLTL